MKTKEDNSTFESNLSAMEAIVKKMEAGGLSLAETMACYEAGVKLSSLLKTELENAESRLMQLKDGKLSPAGDERDV